MSSSTSFEDLIVNTHNELCVKWRMEIVSCRENPVDINVQLNSLEQVMQAFEFGEFESTELEPQPMKSGASSLLATVSHTKVASKVPQPRPAAVE